MFLQRPPTAQLRPFVAQLWASGNGAPGVEAGPVREHMLPTGSMHLVFRLAGSGALRLTDPGACPVGSASLHQPGEPGVLVGMALVGGARSRYYLRELEGPSNSVGVVLHPGAALGLLGAPADSLAQRHTELHDLWGSAAAELHERLCAAPHAAARLALLEQALLARLPQVHGIHPGVDAVLHRLVAAHTVEAAVRHSGLSHRQFILQFRRAVGLAPKTYLRVLRFQQALKGLRGLQPSGLAKGPGASVADAAHAAGYADQSHFSRDFLAVSGVTPGTYLRLAPRDPNHLSMPLAATPVPQMP